jgi:hypothetical protein
LDLSHTTVTDRGIRYVQEMDSIEWLNVKGTKVTSAGVANLRKRLPQAKIISAMLAREMLMRVSELQKSAAQWPDIWQTLNPDEDPEVQKLLEEWRQPHLFAPHTGLNVLVEGCRRTIAVNPEAGCIEALQEAINYAKPITGDQ